MPLSQHTSKENYSPYSPSKLQDGMYHFYQDQREYKDIPDITRVQLAIFAVTIGISRKFMRIRIQQSESELYGVCYWRRRRGGWYVSIIEITVREN